MFQKGQMVYWKDHEHLGYGWVVSSEPEEDTCSVRFLSYKHYRDDIALGSLDYHEVLKDQLVMADQTPMNVVNDYYAQKQPHSPLQDQVGGNHYKSMRIQPVEFILANELGFCEGNIVKYTCRYKQKGGIQDLKKVIHYAELLISEMENKQGLTNV